MTKEEKWYRDYFGLPAGEVPELGTGDRQSIKMLKDYSKHLLQQTPSTLREFLAQKQVGLQNIIGDLNSRQVEVTNASRDNHAIHRVLLMLEDA